MMVDAPSCYNESNNDGTLINADNDFRLHDAIKSHNGPSLKKMFLDPSQEIPLSDLSAEYTSQLSRLNQQDSSGNTPFHLLVLSKQWHTWHTKLMEWIVNYLHVIAHKIGKDIDLKNDIQAILAIENKDQLTALNISIMHGHELFIKILLNDEYLSKDMAEDGVKFAQSCPEPRANGLVGLLKDYINKQDSSQATVRPDELSKDGYISSLKSWLATTLAHSHHMADSISKQLIEWLKINKRNNQNIFAYLISNEALNKDSSALDMVTQILNLLGDPLKNHNVQEFMAQMFQEKDNEGLNVVDLLVIHNRKALLEVFIDNKYSIPNDIAAGALALANRYPNKQGTFELLKAYLSEQNKSLPTQGIDILDIAFKSPGLGLTNMDIDKYIDEYDIDMNMDIVNMLNDDNHKNVSIKSSLEQTEAPQDILHSTIQLASGCEEPKLPKVPKKSDRRRKRNQVNKGLSTKGSLKKRQARVHTGEKTYICATCGKAFSQMGSRDTHELGHTGEKRHICETCGNAFTQKIQLKTHERRHTGAKPHICGICGRAFSQMGSRDRHNRLHTGEKRYKCDTCGEAFMHKTQLKTHQAVHTK